MFSVHGHTIICLFLPPQQSQLFYLRKDLIAGVLEIEGLKPPADDDKLYQNMYHTEPLVHFMTGEFRDFRKVSSQSCHLLGFMGSVLEFILFNVVWRGNMPMLTPYDGRHHISLRRIQTCNRPHVGPKLYYCATDVDNALGLHMIFETKRIVCGIELGIILSWSSTCGIY